MRVIRGRVIRGRVIRGRVIRGRVIRRRVIRGTILSKGTIGHITKMCVRWPRGRHRVARK